jgi:acetyl esterase
MSSIDGISLHPEARRLLKALEANPLPPYECMTPAEARAMARAFTRSGDTVQRAVDRIEDRLIPSTSGTTRCRIYQPDRRPNGPPTPAILYFHGGGWVVCDIDTHDDICRQLCAASGALVASVDYRLAPEHKFPAAVEDGTTALHWLQQNAMRLLIHPDRVFVAGDSAGGNLATVTALESTRGSSPALAGQILFYPVTDLATEHASYTSTPDGLPLTGSTMRWFRNHYLRMQADALDWRASPLRAADLAALPPTLLVTAEHDPLRDEGIAYGKKLASAGVEVTHLHYYQHMHGFLSMAPHLSDAVAALSITAAWTQSVLRTRTASHA